MKKQNPRTSSIIKNSGLKICSIKMDEYDYLFNVEDKVQIQQKKDEVMKKKPIDPRDVFEKKPKNTGSSRKYKRSVVDKKEGKTKSNKLLEEYL